MTREDIKTINDIVHKTIYGFFDICGDEETPMTDKDKLLLEVNKTVCNNIKNLEQEPQTMHWQKHTDASGNSWHTCPTCGHIAYTLSHYCPDCGARLEAPA